MPSKVKLFGRRRSSGNVLDIAPENPEPTQQSSFRVLERPDKATHIFQSPAKNGGPPKRVTQIRSFNSPLQQLRGKSADDLGVGSNRGSAGTTNSGSSGYYESSSASARHSSSSTLPSSLDQDREPDEEELYPRKAATTPMLQSLSADDNEPLPPPPSFSSRAARALSFGQKHNRTNSHSDEHLPPAPLPASYNGVPRSPVQSRDTQQDMQRDRSWTNSSYASTAKPVMPEPNLSFGETNFGEDFGNMFAKPPPPAEEAPLPPPPIRNSFHRTVGACDAESLGRANKPQESEPMFPPKSYSRQALTPSPGALRNARDEPGSPYEWNERSSQDGMLSSSALSSPRLMDDGPPVPAHGNGITPAFLGRSKAGYALVAERGSSPGFERTSSESNTSGSGNEKERVYQNVQSHEEDDNPWTKRVELRDSQGPSLHNAASNNSFRTAASSSHLHPAQTQAGPGASRAGAISPGSSHDGDLFSDTSNTTPRAAVRSVQGFQDEPLHDSSPVGPPSRAVRPSGTPKRMTTAQFEMLQRRGEDHLDRTHDEAQLDDEDEDEDDAERLKRAAKQRRKQEATMAIYRQQMKKVAGGGPGDLPAMGRPNADRAMSGFHLGGVGGPPPMDSIRGKDLDDEDDDVPLGVLQAHGFPSAGRPPTRMNDTDRRTSVAGSVIGGGAGQGNLPPFARRLPADPYFGASLQNPANRESLAFSSGQSVYGGAPVQTPMGHPGGLIGVIAGEERAKAARRGSPNPATGTYGPIPLPSNMHPGMPRTMSMGSVVGPQVYTPSGAMANMPPMPMMMMPPQDQTQAQMQQFMQIQMQVMQNMLAMQQQQMGQSPQPLQQPPTDYLGVPLPGNRPMSMASQAPSFLGAGPNGGRAMTMMNPPPQWGFNDAANHQRPTSAMPQHYGPSMQGLSPLPGGGPAPGYTPSIAPSERSNVGMPSRYRPVSTNGDAATTINGGGRSQSMTSSLTLQAFTNNNNAASSPAAESNSNNKSTIRIVDKPKGTPKVSTRPVAADEDEDEGWAEMARKKAEKKFSWRRKDNATAGKPAEPALSELYKGMEE